MGFSEVFALVAVDLRILTIISEVETETGVRHLLVLYITRRDLKWAFEHY